MGAASYALPRAGVPVLLISADDQDYSSLHHILEPDFRVHRANTRKAASSVIRRYSPSVVICEQTFEDGDWRDILADLQTQTESPQLIVSSRLADDRLWVEVLNLGGYDLLVKPFTPSEVSRVVGMAARRKRSADE